MVSHLAGGCAFVIWTACLCISIGEGLHGGVLVLSLFQQRAGVSQGLHLGVLVMCASRNGIPMAVPSGRFIERMGMCGGS